MTNLNLPLVSVGEAITKNEAKHLANETSRLGPKHPELYWIKLDVFHQLHCLVRDISLGL